MAFVRPHVKMIVASSLNGMMSQRSSEGDSERLKRGFTIPEDTAYLKECLKGCDAVLISQQTIGLTKGPLRIPGKKSLWIVASQSKPQIKHDLWFKLQDDLKITEHSLKGSLEDLLTYLSEKQIKTLAILGGRLIHQWFWEKGFVDELHLTLCPRFLVGGIPLLPSQLFQKEYSLELIELKQKESHIFLHYKTFI